MAEYIERERLTVGVLGLTIVDPMVAQYADAVLLQIQQVPAADVVPVVRCKDCKWFAECVGKDSGKPCGYGQCTRPLCMRSLIGTDDFCSYGERKDGE